MGGMPLAEVVPRTAVLGFSAALTTHCVVIHYRLVRFAYPALRFYLNRRVLIKFAMSQRDVEDCIVWYDCLQNVREDCLQFYDKIEACKIPKKEVF